MQYDGLGVQEGDALELQQGVVQGVSGEIPHPLGHHDSHHDGQQELDVVGDLHLKVSVGDSERSGWLVYGRETAKYI